MDKKFYITTPIYYPSDNLHIGHTYCTVATDCVKRFKKMQGYDVFFTTGTDEHGQKIQEKAKEFGMEPKAYVDKIVANIKKLWEALDIDYDAFIRSTDEVHEKNVQRIFQKLYDKGDIYKGEYEGYYCTPCEAFWTEAQLGEGHTCPDCGRETHLTHEESYFFRLSNYKDRLLELYEKNPEFIEPAFRKNEMVKNFFETGEGLEDLSVSRSTFDWGVKVPFDDKHVVYVWIDALSCYLSALGLGTENSKMDEFWPADVHFVGKEIIRFHVIIWPAILMALDLPLPKKVFGHGWILFDNDKMSKSKGNVIYPEPIISLYGVDALKYFLLREFSFGSDGSFNIEKFMQRLNSDLANDLGNLLSRTVSMISKYNDGIIEDKNVSEDVDDNLKDMAVSVVDEVEKAMEHYHFSNALESIWKLIRRTNKYVDETEPWKLAKDENSRDRLLTVLYNLAETLRIVSILIHPFIENTSLEIRKQLGIKADINWDDSKVFGLIEDGTLVEKGNVIFPRLDINEEIEKFNAENEALLKSRINAKKSEETSNSKLQDIKEEVTIDDLEKLDIRVAKVLEVIDHPNADKLYVLKLKIGTEERQIVTNLKSKYSKEELTGKKILVLVNLKPIKLRGVESVGMLLAAEDENKEISIASTLEDIKDGAKIC
ncbi:methionyl-tRNA synthetase [Peptoniphilus olsenii]|uniref:Methionine--tRNA ligase n=1 Tax=Peptoniphilus olsenii TaxID=411570 RepID=A0ABV2JA77_9FIRM